MSDDYDLFPRKGQSGSGTEEAYSVEVRHNYPTPKAFGDMLLDNRWQTVRFSQAQTGLSAGPSYYHHSRAQGLLGYSAAQALRWWLHASVDAEMLGGLCLETRLVKHHIAYTSQTTIVSEHEVIGGNNRSSVKPKQDVLAKEVEND